MSKSQYQKPATMNATTSAVPVNDKVLSRSILEMKVILHIREIGKTLKQNLTRKIVAKIEGKCVTQGFIRPNSVNILSYSSGNINGEYVQFMCIYECMVCYPVEGMRIQCKVKNISLAGIHAEVEMDGIIPLTIFVARDHNYNNKLFSTVQVGAMIETKIIGIRFELNDPYICAIASLVDNGSERLFGAPTAKPKLQIRTVADAEAEEEGVEELQ
jgi:DNA-directed RNA polymerase subunit E'/Rpb7